MLLGILLTAALLPASLASASQGSHRAVLAARQSVLVEGHPTAGQQELYKRADGSINLDFLHAETHSLRRKYGGVRNKTLAARAVVPVSVGVPLYNWVEGTLNIGYYGGLTIGTPPQKHGVIFDTGSADLWLPVMCQTVCAGGLFKPKKSTTYKSSGDPFFIEYAVGSAFGIEAVDTVTLGGLTVKNVGFGAVLDAGDTSAQPVVGIMGLAFQSISQIGTPNFVERLVAQKRLKANLFAFYLSRGKLAGSQLSIGAVNAKHYTGSITYTPVTSADHWKVKMTGWAIEGKVTTSTVGAAIDTGTSLIYVPTAMAAKIYSKIPGAKISKLDSDSEVTIWSYPCSSKPNIALTFGGSTKQYKMDPRDLNLGFATGSKTQCAGGILGWDLEGMDGKLISIVGDAFLKSWYSVYNYAGIAGKPAVGFAAYRA